MGFPGTAGKSHPECGQCPLTMRYGLRQCNHILRAPRLVAILRSTYGICESLFYEICCQLDINGAAWYNYFRQLNSRSVAAWR